MKGIRWKFNLSMNLSKFVNMKGISCVLYLKSYYKNNLNIYNLKIYYWTLSMIMWKLYLESVWILFIVEN